MEFKILLLCLTIISPVFSKTLGSWEEADDTDSELDWLFNGGEAEEDEKVDDKYTVCDTKECQIVAEDFKRTMNKSADPCDNFYEYVCGNWDTHNPIAPYAYESSRIQKFQDIVFSRIKGILETPPETSDILPVRQAKKWYRSCMDTAALERRGLKPLESILVQTGGWPMTMDPEEWNEDDHTWQSIEEHYLHITGEYVFYEVSSRHGEKGGIVLREGYPPLNYQIEFKYRNYSGDKYDGYVELIKEIVELLVDEHRADISKKKIEKDVRNMVEFEKQLYLLNKEHYDGMDTTIEEFIEMYDANITEIENEDVQIEKIDFRHLIRRIFDMVRYAIQDSTSLQASNNLEYWIKLTKILNETPKRTIVNYIHWRFVSGMIFYMTENMRELIFKYESKEYGLTGRQPRWMECIYQMKMTGAASYAFTKKYFHEDTEKDVREMIDHIRGEMKSQIEKTTWLDEEAKELAIDKLNAMKVFLGYPDWYKNKTSVLNSYKGLTIGSDHFGNVLSYGKYQVKRELHIFSEHESSVEPTIINAFYDPTHNSIELPAADFQPPLFTSKLPRNINYGMAGVVIGHEIGHGFDDQGIKIGKDGNETQLSKHMMDMYYKRAECFLDQFNEYWGVTDSDEVTQEYLAYRKMMKKSHKRDYKLPGFEEYTDNQMFFVSFGIMWCGTERPAFAEEMSRYAPHSPARLRVIGPLSNTNDFAEAFNCPKGSPMNPDDKCDIWKSSKTHSNLGEDPELSAYYKLMSPKWHGNW